MDAVRFGPGVAPVMEDENHDPNDNYSAERPPTPYPHEEGSPPAATPPAAPSLLVPIIEEPATEPFPAVRAYLQERIAAKDLQTLMKVDFSKPRYRNLTEGQQSEIVSTLAKAWRTFFDGEPFDHGPLSWTHEENADNRILSINTTKERDAHPFGAAGFLALCFALSDNPKIEALFIAAPRFLDDERIKSVASILHTLPNLKELQLDGRFGNAGVDQVVEALTHAPARLKSLYLNGTYDAEAAQMVTDLADKRQIPQTQVFFFIPWN